MAFRKRSADKPCIDIHMDANSLRASVLRLGDFGNIDPNNIVAATNIAVALLQNATAIGLDQPSKTQHWDKRHFAPPSSGVVLRARIMRALSRMACSASSFVTNSSAPDAVFITVVPHWNL